MNTRQLRQELVAKAKQRLKDGATLTGMIIATVRFVGDYDPERRQVTDIAIRDGKLVLTVMPYDEGGTFGEPEEMREQQLLDEIDVEELESLVEALE